MAQYARPDSDALVSTSDWGSTSENEEMPGEYIYYTEIDDTTDPTGTGADGTNISIDMSMGSEAIDIRLSNGITDPGVNTGHKLHFRYNTDGNSSGSSLQVQLMQGGVVHASDTVNTTGVSSFAHREYPIPTGDVDDFPDQDDYDALFLRITFTDDDAMDTFYISQIYLEAPDVASAGATATPAAFLLFVD